MPTYEVIVHDTDTERWTGFIRAKNEDAARDYIEERGYTNALEYDDSAPSYRETEIEVNEVGPVPRLTPLNKAQRKALNTIYRRDSQGLSYRAFRRSVLPGPDCVMVKWCGMWLGIEPDGYTHS